MLRMGTDGEDGGLAWRTDEVLTSDADVILREAALLPELPPPPPPLSKQEEEAAEDLQEAADKAAEEEEAAVQAQAASLVGLLE